METTLTIAVYMLYGLSGAAVLGLLVLFVLKLRHLAAEKRERVCLEKYQDYFFYIQAYGEEEGRLKPPAGVLTRSEKRIIQKKLISLLERFTGVHRQKLLDLCDDLGLVEMDLKRLNSWWKWSRVDAAYNLGMMHAEQAVPGIIRLMKKDDNDASMFIFARALAKCARKEKDLREMVELLVGYRQNCQPLIVDILSDSQIDTGPLFASLVREEDADLVKVGLIGLTSHVQPGMDSILDQLVNSADKEVRIKVVKLLCRDIRYLTKRNVSLFLSHPDWEIRSVMAKAIGELGLSTYIPLLKRAVKDPHWWVARNSMNSLAQLQVDGFRALCSIMEEERDIRIREMANQVIQKELEKGKFPTIDLEQQITHQQKLLFYQEWSRKTLSTAHALEK